MNDIAKLGSRFKCMELPGDPPEDVKGLVLQKAPWLPDDIQVQCLEVFRNFSVRDTYWLAYIFHPSFESVPEGELAPLVPYD